MFVLTTGVEIHRLDDSTTHRLDDSTTHPSIDSTRVLVRGKFAARWYMGPGNFYLVAVEAGLRRVLFYFRYFFGSFFNLDAPEAGLRRVLF